MKLLFLRLVTLFFTSLVLGIFSIFGQGNADTPWLGADLSYVNEIEDCGGVYRHKGREIDPFDFFSERGANLTRARLWHTPGWTAYSNLKDASKTIKRAKAAGMHVLLDLHYSDTWADPQGQVIPQAWSHINDDHLLADSLYQYTYSTLLHLYSMALLPRFIQIGNEINIEIMQSADHMVVDTINWERNILLINRGIQAVDDFNEQYRQNIETMIHIAQPENAFYWFESASTNGLQPFDWIGLSYYSKWSEYSIEELSGAIDSLIGRFNKKLMVVETAYPFTMQDADSAANILKQDALIDHYPATPRGQLRYMKDLTKSILDGGGAGVVYWEPAWISSSCSTRWGQGSHWDNATFFDFQGNTLPVFKFFRPYDQR